MFINHSTIIRGSNDRGTKTSGTIVSTDVIRDNNGYIVGVSGYVGKLVNQLPHGWTVVGFL